MEEDDIKVSGGNHIIHLPTLSSNINDIATCKHCYEKDKITEMNDFIEFCELKWW